MGYLGVLVIDANLWVAAFDAGDQLHDESVEVFAAAARQRETLAAPAIVLLESGCALARRLGDPRLARSAMAKISDHPSLRLEALSDELLFEAAELGLERRLRAADALYAATAARLGASLLSWDSELIARAGALSPRDWLNRRGGQPGTVAEPRPQAG